MRRMFCGVLASLVLATPVLADGEVNVYSSRHYDTDDAFFADPAGVALTPDDRIAMCTHGWSGLGRWVLGNVTDRVVRYSGDPVLVIR